MDGIKETYYYFKSKIEQSLETRFLIKKSDNELPINALIIAILILKEGFEPFLIDDHYQEINDDYISWFKALDPHFVCLINSDLNENSSEGTDDRSMDFIGKPIVNKFLKSKNFFYIGAIKNENLKEKVEKYLCHVENIEAFELKLKEITRKNCNN